MIITNCLCVVYCLLRLFQVCLRLLLFQFSCFSCGALPQVLQVCLSCVLGFFVCSWGFFAFSSRVLRFVLSVLRFIQVCLVLLLLLFLCRGLGFQSSFEDKQQGQNRQISNNIEHNTKENQQQIENIVDKLYVSFFLCHQCVLLFVLMVSLLFLADSPDLVCVCFGFFGFSRGNLGLSSFAVGSLLFLRYSWDFLGLSWVAVGFLLAQVFKQLGKPEGLIYRWVHKLWIFIINSPNVEKAVHRIQQRDWAVLVYSLPRILWPDFFARFLTRSRLWVRLLARLLTKLLTNVPKSRGY